MQNQIGRFLFRVSIQSNTFYAEQNDTNIIF